MEVYREVEEFGRNQEESGSFDDFIAHSLDFGWDIGNMNWRI